MSTYTHGVRVNEQSAGARPPVQVDSALPVYTGTAYIHETSKRGNVNIPVLAMNLQEAKDQLGNYDGDASLPEPRDLHLDSYSTGPVVFINVLDPENAAHQSESVELQTYDPLVTDPDQVEIDQFGVLSAVVDRWDDTGITVPAADVGNTGDGTAAAALPATPVADLENGVYSLTCVSVLPPMFELSLAATPIGAAFEADGLPHVIGDLTLTLTEGGTIFVVDDLFTFTVSAWELVAPADYSITYGTSDEAFLVREAAGAIEDDDTVRITVTYLDASGVVAADIVGGYTAGVYTGLSVVHQVYPQLLKVPALILAPAWSEERTVSDKMIAVAGSVSGEFKALAIIDLESDIATIATYAAAAAVKVSQGLAVENAMACWPAVLASDGTTIQHMSTHIACLCGIRDFQSPGSGIPFKGPSNQSMNASAAVQTDSGTAIELYLTRDQANDGLNAQGIVTMLNSPARGWISWGNRTSIYPSDTDPRVAFISVRRMFNYEQTTIILTVERDVDEPGNRRLIDGVVQTIQAMINGWIAVGAMVAGTINFREADNTPEGLADGTYIFFVQSTPPSPAKDLAFTVEYDSSALAALFE